jgi:inosine/xanthosine triphosphate pyrophosphatase family protein
MEWPEKKKISHTSKALAKLQEWLKGELIA